MPKIVPTQKRLGKRAIMKKAGLICAAILAALSLSACGNQAENKAASPKKARTSKVVKHKKQAKHKQKTAQHKDKAQKPKAANSSAAANQTAANTQQQQQNQTQQQGQTQQAQTAQQPQTGNGQLPPSTDLHDFVNRYGESPTAYLTDHYGIAPEQALKMVPRNMKSSGEIQDEILIQQGQDPFKQ